MSKQRGKIAEDAIIKAGCGVRYDPDVLGEDTGFDFSAAETLKSAATHAPPTDAADEASESPEPATKATKHRPPSL